MITVEAFFQGVGKCPVARQLLNRSWTFLVGEFLNRSFCLFYGGACLSKHFEKKMPLFFSSHLLALFLSLTIGFRTPLSHQGFALRVLCKVSLNILGESLLIQLGDPHCLSSLEAALLLGWPIGGQ
ncbi:hypothetical protein O181_019522 [Austropuccinia psidii MF-1]|uniref:Uncharacterized protein n=1 Tax=Austropuccinia psidii MF-1 TaxID=1389203 RepID=A0A9Q3CBQ5_9BASI|nr:hypothetical protein [Austropuccinia psidii MF-1]